MIALVAALWLTVSIPDRDFSGLRDAYMAIDSKAEASFNP